MYLFLIDGSRSLNPNSVIPANHMISSLDILRVIGCQSCLREILDFDVVSVLQSLTEVVAGGSAFDSFSDSLCL